MDLVAVRAAAEEHLEYVRSGNGPFFLEAVTYRFRGHSMGDPERYREKDEIEKWKEEDPIGIYLKYLVGEKIVTIEELDGIDQMVEQEVQEAVEFAESSPEPAAEASFEDIYAD
jgi:pyruvate dehydrogenase E1 component alpha subunit